MTRPPNDAVVQQAGQPSVDGRVWFSEDARHLQRFDERHPAEGVDELSL